MLLQFSVTNHRSIKDTAIISLKASTDKSLSDCLISPDEKKQLVPVLALYGANAAGKSNVLHALLLMREMVCGRYAKLLKGESLPQEPFAFTDQPTQPTSFEAIYFYGGIKYAYGFSFDKSKVLTEYLYHWPNGREALIYSRVGNSYQFRENIQEQLTLSGRTAENRLYLSSSNEWNCPQTEKAYLWFFKKLTGFMGTEMRLDATLSAIRQGGSEKSRILHEMLYADLGIKDIRITGSKEEPIISALHTLDAEDGASRGFWLPLGQESVGTQRFFSRIGMWLAALESGSVLVVDEIESSMHPLLTRHLIEMVQDAAINTNHAQLIFTTHDTGLLDLTLLRRDQIWFAEKDEKTILISSHQLHQIQQICDRVGIFVQGKLVACGAIDELGKQLEQESGFRYEVGANPAGKGLIEALKAVEGVTEVEENDETLMVRAQTDVCDALVKALMAGKFHLTFLRPCGSDLDEIYSRYFVKAGEQNEGSRSGRIFRHRKGEAQA